MVIFGLGIGFILLILIWSLIALFLLLSKTFPLIYKAGFVIIAALISGLLLLLPQQTHTKIISPTSPDVKVLDEFFVPRVITLLLVSLSAVGGLGIVILHCSEPMLAMRLQKSKL